MTKRIVGVVVLPLLLCMAFASGQCQDVAKADADLKDEVVKDEAGLKGKMEGSWQMVSYKYGDTAKFTDWPKNQIMLKHMTPTHFTWVTYDAKTGKVTRMAGGTYSVKGNTYQENLQYGLGEDVKDLIGKPQSFTDQVTGDRWHHSGKLSIGLKIEEIWERVK